MEHTRIFSFGSRMGPKRKRRGGSTCANPLFVRWVEELRDEARRKDQACHFTYTKAKHRVVHNYWFITLLTLYLHYRL